MTFAQRLRLIWIDAHLASHALTRRDDICAAFGVSVPQASHDLTLFQALHPDAMSYDRSAKGYRQAAQAVYPDRAHRAARAIVAAVTAELETAA